MFNWQFQKICLVCDIVQI